MHTHEKNWSVINDETGQTVESNLSLNAAESLLCRCQNEGGDYYLIDCSDKIDLSHTKKMKDPHMHLRCNRSFEEDRLCGNWECQPLDMPRNAVQSFEYLGEDYDFKCTCGSTDIDVHFKDHN